jgi:hypothetical protein
MTASDLTIYSHFLTEYQDHVHGDIWRICNFCGGDVCGYYCTDCVFVCDECFEKKHKRDRARPTTPSFYPGGFDLPPEYCVDCEASMAIPDIKEPE